MTETVNATANAVANAAMSPSDYLTILNILVAFLGASLVVFSLIEWGSLRRLKKDFAALEQRIRAENHVAMKAAHRIIASYGVHDIDARIALLESAIREYPSAFNACNTLGYAYLNKKDFAAAQDAFRRAIALHPEDKAGYCDLGYCYLASGEKELAIRYFRQAIHVDATTVEDIRKDERLTPLLEDILR